MHELIDKYERMSEASPDSCIYAKIAQAEPEKVDDEIRVGGERMPCDDEGMDKSITTAFQFGIVMGFGKKYDEMDKVMEDLKKAITPQPDEDCDTCKHGYFGNRQCDNCRMRYPSHYEREEEHHGSD